MDTANKFPPGYGSEKNQGPPEPSSSKNIGSIIGFAVLIIVLIGVGISYTYFNFMDGSKMADNKVEEMKKEKKPSKSNSQPSAFLSNILEDQESLKQFSSEDDLRKFLEQRSSYNNSHFGFANKAALFEDTAPIRKEAFPSAEFDGFGGGGFAAEDSSTTNIQVAGVDEPDLVKNDNKYIYTISNDSVHVINAFPAEDAQTESIIKLNENATPQRLFVKDNMLVIFGESYTGFWGEPEYDTAIDTFARVPTYQYIKIFDISDKKNPKIVRDLEFEGSYLDARMIGDYVYLVTKTYGDQFYTHPYPMPLARESGEILEGLNSIDKVHYVDIPFTFFQYVSIAAVNITNNEEKVDRKLLLTNNADNFYMSEKNMYLTHTKYVSEDVLVTDVLRDLVFNKLSDDDKALISEIENTSETILSREEKLQKIQIVLDRYSYRLSTAEKKQLEKDIQDALKEKYSSIEQELERTVIHKINIDKNNITYQTSGSVPGHILNQFSMDEYNNTFRIATTLSEQWSRFREKPAESYSNLYVLDNNLKQQGALEQLAPDERIYSTRFMGDRAFMVTFKQVDPLFVIDLKNPNEPKVLGELKIPGFSNYLQPYDENLLVGFGFATKVEDEGFVTQQGLKVSLFDVSDVLNPKEVDNIVLGDRGTTSLATTDHKAVLLSKDKNLLVIPATIREFKDDFDYWGDLTFDGALIFEINESQLKQKGRISHLDGSNDEDYVYIAGNSFQEASVMRSLYLDNTLYTLSQSYLKAHEISDLAEKKTLLLDKNAQPEKPDFEIITPVPLEVKTIDGDTIEPF